MTNELRAIAEAAKDVALRLLAGDAADTVWKAADAITSLLADLEAAEAWVEQAREDGRKEMRDACAGYLDGYAGGHYMAQSCAAAIRSLPYESTALANPTEEAQP